MSDTHFDPVTSLRQARQKGETAARQAKSEVSDAIPAFVDAVRAIADALRIAGRKASVVMSELGEDAQDTGATPAITSSAGFGLARYGLASP